MKIRRDQNGYAMWLSANDTYSWAHKASAVWLYSTLSGHRLYVEVDSNGLCDCLVDTVDDPSADGHEIEAIVADHLPADLRRFWPVWEKQTS